MKKILIVVFLLAFIFSGIKTVSAGSVKSKRALKSFLITGENISCTNICSYFKPPEITPTTTLKKLNDTRENKLKNNKRIGKSFSIIGNNISCTNMSNNLVSNNKIPENKFADVNTTVYDWEEATIYCPNIDERKTLAVVLTAPVPTPSVVNYISYGNSCKDKRTWTKFKYSSEIEKVALKYRLDPQLIYATIMTESSGNVYAYRYEPYLKDASLCMGQILVSTARSLGFAGKVNDLYKPEICIDLVGKYHRIMLDEFGNLTPEQLAIAYNAGSPWKRPVPGHLYRFDIWYNGGEI